jgi:L,D-peptidoglycan transpeptidase YkuD (ErfK/YbiS/YcfS/YnhG family)
MKPIGITLLMTFFTISQTGFCQTIYANLQAAKDIIAKQESQISKSKQILIVSNEQQQSNKATLVAFEKSGKHWKVKFGPMDAWVGRNGFANSGLKVEGDGKSPSGVFALGRLFGYEAKVNTKMPFTQTTQEDKWIDDPESPDYNRHVRGPTTAKSFENLLLSSDAYKYCMVIEYNTNPVVKGKGSAIFFHLGEGATAGCVAIKEDKMKPILKWMNPKHNPTLIMGNLTELKKGWK